MDTFQAAFSGANLCDFVICKEHLLGKFNSIEETPGNLM